ncbi:MAG: preprotein translocase subunit SecE [Rikenellaceae bacterium]
MIQYIKDSYNELVNKVAWPSMSELQSSTIVVMVATSIFAVVILAMDLSFEGIMGAIYKTLGSIAG